MRYMAGCRCFKCRRANSDYERDRAAARRRGDWNGIVPAEKARAHLKRLSRNGIGRRAVSAASDVPLSVLMDIKQGRKKRIRARTERKILAVNVKCRSDRSFVPAGRVWQHIGALLEEGFSKAAIARQLGLKRPALQIGKHRVTARTAHRIDRLFKRFTT